jgi:hypothetical protein
MRFDTPVFFLSSKKGEYDHDTGNYKPDTVEETQCWASVTETREDTLNLIYGEIKQGCYTVRLQNIYRKVVYRIRIGDKLYKVDFRRRLRTKDIFVVSEVQ